MLCVMLGPLVPAKYVSSKTYMIGLKIVKSSNGQNSQVIIPELHRAYSKSVFCLQQYNGSRVAKRLFLVGSFGSNPASRDETYMVDKVGCPCKTCLVCFTIVADYSQNFRGVLCPAVERTLHITIINPLVYDRNGGT